MPEKLKPDECIERLQHYGFKDDIGHPLENCEEYIQLCAYAKLFDNITARLHEMSECGFNVMVIGSDEKND
jgi:hypothetical protein